MHPRNPYDTKKPDFVYLADRHSGLKPLYVEMSRDTNIGDIPDEISVQVSSDGFVNIDWKDSNALRALTTALLEEDWELDVELLGDRLCPTVCHL